MLGLWYARVLPTDGTCFLIIEILFLVTNSQLQWSELEWNKSHLVAPSQAPNTLTSGRRLHS